MIVICPRCGEVNQIKKVKISRPTLDIVCKKCGARHSLEIGVTSHSAAMVKCPHCGYKQIRAERCAKCGGSLIIQAVKPADLGTTEENEQSIFSKRYKVLTITAAAMIVLILLGSIAGVFLMMKISDPYKLSEAFIRNNKEIKAVVGEDLKFGLVPLGSVKMSGKEGTADFKVYVKGSKGSTYVNVFLRKQRNKWRVVSASYTDQYGVKRRLPVRK